MQGTSFGQPMGDVATVRGGSAWGAGTFAAGAQNWTRPLALVWNDLQISHLFFSL